MNIASGSLACGGSFLNWASTMIIRMHRFRLGAIIAAIISLDGSAAAAEDLAGRDASGFIAALFIIGFFLYMIPTWIAFLRGHPNRWPIAVINFVFAGTGLGWLGCLVWAFSAVHRSPTGNNGGESGLNVFVNDPKLVTLTPDTAKTESAEIGDRLLRLKKLCDDGAISREEYERLKRPLIESL